MYDPKARGEALELLCDGDLGIDRPALRRVACQLGLDGVSGGMHLGRIARDLVDIARAGQRRWQQLHGDDPEATVALDALEATVTGNDTAAWKTVSDKLRSHPSLEVLADHWS